MSSSGKRLAKGTACGIAMLAYGYVFRQWISPVLTPAMSSYPVLIQKVGLIVTLLPIWLIATYVATKLLPRPSAATKHADE